MKSHRADASRSVNGAAPLRLLLCCALLAWLAGASVQAQDALQYETSLEGNTVKGVVRVPRGMTILLKERTTYMDFDRVLIFATVPADLPIPTLDFVFDCTVLVDEHGLGEGYHWHTVTPKGYFISGTDRGNSDILPERGIAGPRPPSIYRSAKAVLASHWPVFQLVPLCDWVITAADNGDSNGARLQLWVSPDTELLRVSAYRPLRAAFAGELWPNLSKLEWKKWPDPDAKPDVLHN